MPWGGLDWITQFFPEGSQTFQLDIVGFLAILGEGSVETIAQIATLSYLIYLPRILPAPQIFIRPSRPEKLETTSNAKVVGIYSGNTSEDIHHVAHALHRGDKLAPNTVLCVKVTENDRPRPSPRRFGPLALLAFAGFAMSLTLMVLAFYYEDGMALIATITLSFLSTNAGIANKWRPTPNNPAPDPHSPPGDVVIKYPQGAFIVVKCAETTARYLYFNPSERCIYTIESTAIYRGLSLISTLMLMAGVITLANAKIQCQAAFAGAYIVINILYWIGAALPPASHWDLSRLQLELVDVHGGTPPRSARIDNVNPTYTEALWKAIAVTGTKNWVREAGWAPKTPVWDEWLLEAEDAAISEPMRISYHTVNRIEEFDGRSIRVGRWTMFLPKLEHKSISILRWSVPVPTLRLPPSWRFRAIPWSSSSKHQVVNMSTEKGYTRVEVWTIRNWDSRNALSTLLRSRTTTNLQNRV